MPTEQERGGVPPPYPLAMVICDAIWRDSGTGKRTILGVFSGLVAKSFPAQHPIMAVYIAATDGHGKVRLALQIVSSGEGDAEEETVFRAEGDVEFVEPRAVVEIDFNIQGLVFPQPGEYRFQLFADDQFLMERRLMVQQAPGAALRE
jgi:hypothetical protein